MKIGDRVFLKGSRAVKGVVTHTSGQTFLTYVVWDGPAGGLRRPIDGEYSNCSLVNLTVLDLILEAIDE